MKNLLRFLKNQIKEVRLGYLFLGACILIALVGVFQETFTIRRLLSVSGNITPEIRGIAQTAYFMAIAGLSISFAVALGLLWSVGRPILELATVCREVTKGNQRARVLVKSGGELGLMGRSFNRMLDERQRQDENLRSLLDGLKEAVFFFDRHGTISEEKSGASGKIFPKLVGQTQIQEFFACYSSMSEKNIRAALDLVWDPSVGLSFASIAELLPQLTQFEDAGVEGGTRFVAFHYSAERDSLGKLQRVIVVAHDRTKEAIAALESEHQRERVTRISLISASLPDYLAYVEETRQLFQRLTEAFRSLSATNAANAANLATIELTSKRDLHSLKGGLASYEFKSAAKRVHELESICSELLAQGRHAEIGETIAKIEKDVTQEMAELDSVFSLAAESEWSRVAKSKLHRLKTAVELESQVQLKELIESLEEQSLATQLAKYQRYLNALSERDGTKLVKLVVDPTSAEVLPNEIQSLSNCLGHLLRNCFDHGIESVEERESLGKDPEGSVTFVAQRIPTRGLRLVIRDDGRGIAVEKLVKKALKNGLWTEEKALAASEKEKLELIFADGLSTRDEVSETSGRGVGMDAVRAELISRGGRIELESQIGHGTSFTIEIGALKTASLK